MALVGSLQSGVNAGSGVWTRRADRSINGSIVDMWRWRRLRRASLWQWWDCRLGFRLRGLPYDFPCLPLLSQPQHSSSPYSYFQPKTVPPTRCHNGPPARPGGSLTQSSTLWAHHTCQSPGVMADICGAAAFVCGPASPRRQVIDDPTRAALPRPRRQTPVTERR